MSTSVIAEETLQALRELETDEDDDLFGELIELFLEDAPARLGDMRDAIQNGDGQSLMRQAHSLKGSAGNLGAHGMAALCSRVEKHAREGLVDGMAVTFEQLQKEFEMVREVLEMERFRSRDERPH